VSYNKRYLYEKIIEIQEITLSEQGKGLSLVEIYSRYIRRQFHISHRTFERYLGINAKKHIKELDINSSSDKCSQSKFNFDS